MLSGCVPTLKWDATAKPIGLPPAATPCSKSNRRYRAAPGLARDLRADEVQEFTRLVRRLAALLALAPALDAAYAASAAGV